MNNSYNNIVNTNSLIINKCIPDCKKCPELWLHKFINHTIKCECICHTDNTSKSNGVENEDHSCSLE